MQNCKTTVVIPNYNGIKYIRACLDSLKTIQGECEFHTLVIDNGSKDGSLEIIEKDYPWAELIPLPENTGFCHAVNVGIEACKTEYVLLLNNDTIVKPGFVKNLETAIEESPDIFSVNPMMLTMQDENIVDNAGIRYCVLGWAADRGKGKECSGFLEKTEVFAACGGASLYRRAVFEQIGTFDENHFAYLEDVDIGYRAKIFGYRNMYEPSAKVIHAGSGTSGSRYNEFKTRLSSANNAYLIGKNMPILQVLINLPFLLGGFLVKALFFYKKKMGKLYVQGYWKGIKRCFLPEGKAHKVVFNKKHFKHYLKIQMMLYIDTVRVFIKS